MEFTVWKRFLCKWVRACDFIEPKATCLEEAEPEAFFDQYAKCVNYDREVSDNPLRDFLQEKFPSFQAHLKENGCIATKDYVLVYTILWRYSCDNTSSNYFLGSFETLPACIKNLMPQMNSMTRRKLRIFLKKVENANSSEEMSEFLAELGSEQPSSNSGVDSDKYFWMDDEVYPNMPPEVDANAPELSSNAQSAGDKEDMSEPFKPVPDEKASDAASGYSCESGAPEIAPDSDNVELSNVAESGTNEEGASEMPPTKSASSRNPSGEETADGSIEQAIQQSTMINGNVDKETLIELLKDHIRALHAENENKNISSNVDEQVEELQQQLNLKITYCDWYEEEMRLHLEHIEKLQLEQSDAQSAKQEMGSVLKVLKEHLIGSVSGMLRLKLELDQPLGADNEGPALLAEDVKNQQMRHIAHINRLIAEHCPSDEVEQPLAENCMETLVDQLQQELTVLENKNMYMSLEVESLTEQHDDNEDLKRGLQAARDELYDMKSEHLQLNHHLLVYKSADKSKELSTKLQSYQHYAGQLEQQLGEAIKVIGNNNRDLADLKLILSHLKESLSTVEQPQFAQLHQEVERLEQRLTTNQHLSRRAFSELETEMVSQLLAQQKYAASELDLRQRAIVQLKAKSEIYQTHIKTLQKQLSQAQGHLKKLAAERLEQQKRLELEKSQKESLQVEQSKLEMELKITKGLLKKVQDDCQKYITLTTCYRQRLEHQQLQQTRSADKEKRLEQELNDMRKTIKGLEVDNQIAEKHQLAKMKRRETELVEQLNDSKFVNSQVNKVLLSRQAKVEELLQQLQESQAVTVRKELKLLAVKQELESVNDAYEKLLVMANGYRRNIEKLQQQLQEQNQGQAEGTDEQQLPSSPETTLKPESQLEQESNHAGEDVLRFKQQRQRLTQKLASYRDKIRHLEQMLMQAHNYNEAMEDRNKRELDTASRCKEEQLKKLQDAKAELESELNTAEQDKEELMAHREELQRSLADIKKQTENKNLELSKLQQLQQTTLRQVKELKQQLESSGVQQQQVEPGEYRKEAEPQLMRKVTNEKISKLDPVEEQQQTEKREQTGEATAEPSNNNQQQEDTKPNEKPAEQESKPGSSNTSLPVGSEAKPSLQEINAMRLRQHAAIYQLRYRIDRLRMETRAVSQRELVSRRKVQGLEIKLAQCNEELNNMRYTSEDLLQERVEFLDRLENLDQQIFEYRTKIQQLESDCQKLQEQCVKGQSKPDLICGSSQTVLSIDPRTTGHPIPKRRRSTE